MNRYLHTHTHTDPAPAMPINVQVTSLTAQSATVSWEHPNSSSMSIQVLFWEVSNTTYRSQQVESGLTSAYLSDLNSFIRYWVRVRIVCETGGFGPLSDPVSFTTASSSELLLPGVLPSIHLGGSRGCFNMFLYLYTAVISYDFPLRTECVCVQSHGNS